MPLNELNLSAGQRKVCIIQRRLTHYRLPMFENLRAMLGERGVGLDLLVGHCTEAEKKKNDTGELPWARSIPTRYWADGRLCWQPVHQHIGQPALVVVPQENRLLHNHLLLLAPRRFKLAFWGHGANLQSGNLRGVKERFKRWTTRQVDWWFAYTQMSADLVTAARFPDERVTVLNNSVDTSELLRQRQSVTEAEVRALREALGIGAAPVGVFVGSLYDDKRLDFLFEAAVAIRRSIPDFHLLIVGDGPERGTVQGWCAAQPWVRWVGAQFGRDKAAHCAVAQLMLNPGLVGLGILDSFVCGVPMMTTDCGLHSPEISYLHNGVNGVMTVNDLNTYVEACVALLRDPARLAALREGCEVSAREYTVENMARNFCSGVLACLERPRFRAS